MRSDDTCPHCGCELTYDEVDIGVGVMRGNPGCENCGWAPERIVLIGEEGEE